MHRVLESQRAQQLGIALCAKLLEKHPPQNGRLDWELTDAEHREVMTLLTEVFGGRAYGPKQLRRPGTCAYCERLCDNRGHKEADGYNEVDHFRPRHHFNDQTFTWENLMYVCHRCNHAKDDQFPGKTIDSLIRWREAEGYVEPAESEGYINPRTEDPNDFFYFTKYGEIEARKDENDLPSWSRAIRTIYDLRLKDDNICELRREQFFMVFVALHTLSERRSLILQRWTRKDQAFSSFIMFAHDQGWFDNPPQELKDFVAASISRISPK